MSTKSDTLSLRIRRAQSWLDRAERESSNDPDAAFIFYWIAFNALYAVDGSDDASETNEWEYFNDYFRKIAQLDIEHKIHTIAQEKLSDPIETLLDNPYVFRLFWKHQSNTGDCKDWRDSLEKSKEKMKFALGDRDCRPVLEIIFDRLYVLRNQLLHGAATWNGFLNRKQVEDSTKIMVAVLPLLIDLMQNNPQEDWGKPYYPPTSDDWKPNSTN